MAARLRQKQQSVLRVHVAFTSKLYIYPPTNFCCWKEEDTENLLSFAQLHTCQLVRRPEKKFHDHANIVASFLTRNVGSSTFGSRIAQSLLLLKPIFIICLGASEEVMIEILWVPSTLLPIGS